MTREPSSPWKGPFICCDTPSQELPWRVQSHWGRSTSSPNRTTEPDLEACESSQALSSATKDPGLDVEALVQGCLVAVMDLHQKRAEELHAQVLSRLADIEVQLLRNVGETVSYEVTEQETESERPMRKSEHSAAPGKVIRGCTTMQTTSTGETEHPDRGAWSYFRGLVRTAIRSDRFEMLVTVLIMLSVLVSFVELEWEGYMADVSLGLQPPGKWPGAEPIFLALGQLFNLAFLLEFLGRCIAGGRHYMGGPWAWFDAFFVSVGLLDVLGLAWGEAQQGEAQQGLGALRLVRCLRMLRGFRAAKGVRALRPLILLVQTIVGSMVALFWSTVFLFLVQLMGAIFVTKSLHGFVTDEHRSREDRLWANRVFGSGLKSLYTFFEITFSGGWPSHVRPLVEKAGWLYAIFFVLYIAVWAFVIMRVIGALFIKETLATAEKVESARHAREAERRKMTRKIADYFKRCGLTRVSATGAVGWEELEMLFEDPSVRAWCLGHDVDLEDAQNLWMLLSSKGTLSVVEFVDGLLHLREPAKSIDVKALLQSTRGLVSHCESIRDKVSTMEARLNSFEGNARKKFLSESSRTQHTASNRSKE